MTVHLCDGLDPCQCDHIRRKLAALEVVMEWLDDRADVVDGPDDETGPSQRPNDAMSLQMEIAAILDPGRQE